MKRLYLLFVAALIASVSCDKQININEPAQERFSITASAGTDTRTVLDDGFKVNWMPSDRLGVFDVDGVTEFVTDIEAASHSAAFTCTGTFDMPEDLSTAALVAFYPYASSLSADWSSYTVSGVEIPASQTAVAGSFDPDAAVSWAMGTFETKDNLIFHNLYSLLKVTVAQDGVSKVTLKANGGESLAGSASVSLATGAMTISNGESEVALSGSFKKGETYYVSVCPGTYASGFTLLFDGKEVKSTSKAIELKANYVYNLGEVSASADPSQMTWYLAGTFNNWNPADENYILTKDGQWFKITLGLSAGDEAKFYAGSAEVNRGMKGTSYNDSKNFSVVQDGNNIKVSKNGAYEFWLADDGEVARVAYIGTLPTPDGNQWKFNYDELNGVSSIIDLGVTLACKFILAYDMEALYGSQIPAELRGKYQLYIQAWDYEVIPQTKTSGIINLVGEDYYGGVVKTPMYYTGYDGNKLRFTCEMLGIYDVQMTLVTRKIPVYIDDASIVG